MLHIYIYIYIYIYDISNLRVKPIVIVNYISDCYSVRINDKELFILVGQDSTVGVSTRRGLNGPGIESR